MCGGLRGERDNSPPLDGGRCKVLTVLVLSHPSPVGTQVQDTEKDDGLFRWAGRGARSKEGEEEGGHRVWPVWHVALQLWRPAAGEGEGKAPSPADRLSQVWPACSATHQSADQPEQSLRVCSG